MHHRQHWPQLVLVALAAAMPALAAQEPARQMPSGQPAFVIDLDTTGGFTGRGRGGVTVDSLGHVRAARQGALCFSPRSGGCFL